MFNSEFLSDLILEIEDDSTLISLNVHKAILSQKSEFFYTMFKNFSEKYKKSIKIKVCNAKIASDIIASFYEDNDLHTNSLIIETKKHNSSENHLDEIVDLFYCLNYFSLIDVKNIKKIFKNMNDENKLIFLKLMKTNGIKIKKYMDSIKINNKNVDTYFDFLNSIDFDDISEDFILNYLPFYSRKKELSLNLVDCFIKNSTLLILHNYVENLLDFKICYYNAVNNNSSLIPDFYLENFLDSNKYINEDRITCQLLIGTFYYVIKNGEIIIWNLLKKKNT